MKVLLSGATGFIGKNLASQLASQGHLLHLLTRNPSTIAPKAISGLSASPSENKTLTWFSWPVGGPFPEKAIEGVDAVLHLAGENIGTWPWTTQRKLRIRESRVARTRALVEAMGRQKIPPKIFIASSAMGYYGDGANELCEESNLQGQGFLAEVVGAWEAEIFKAQAFGIRTVALRTGIVLGAEKHQGTKKPAGALGKMLPPFKFGLGTIMGNGHQYWSWIHLADIVGIFCHALEHADTVGPLNACAPEPITQEGFSRLLAQALGRPRFFRIPAWTLHLVLGGMAEPLLEGQRGSAKKLTSLGYLFRYPSLPAALAEILHDD